MQVIAHVRLQIIFNAQNKQTKYRISFRFKAPVTVLTSVNDATTSINYIDSLALSKSLITINYMTIEFTVLLFIVSTGGIRWILWFSVRYAAAARREIFRR